LEKLLLLKSAEDMCNYKTNMSSQYSEGAAGTGKPFLRHCERT